MNRRKCCCKCVWKSKWYFKTDWLPSNLWVIWRVMYTCFYTQNMDPMTAVFGLSTTILSEIFEFLCLTIWFGSNTEFTDYSSETKRIIIILYYEQTKWSTLWHPLPPLPFISALQHSAVFTAAQCSALQFAKNQGREYIGVGPVSRSMAPWMRTGTSLCTDLSPSSLDVETY